MANNRDFNPSFKGVTFCLLHYKSLDLMRNHFVWLVFIVLSLNVLLFTYCNSIPYVKSDGWRFIDIYLMPWNEGKLGLSGLFRDHHPQPLTAGLFILNAELFGLRMDYEGMLGVVFLILGCFFIIKEMKNRTLDGLSIVTVSTIMMSMVSVNIYTWSLVTIGYIEGLFSLLVIIYVDRMAKTRIGQRDLFALVVWLVLFSLIFGDGAKLTLVSIAGVFVMSSILEKKIELIKIIMTIVIALVIKGWIYHLLGVHEPYSGKLMSGGMWGAVTYFDEFMRYIGIALMSAWGNLGIYKNYFGYGDNIVDVAGLIVLVLYLATCFIYFKSKIYEKTKIPIVLIAIGTITAVAAWVFRYNPELQEPVSANIPRYYRLYSYGLIGVVWVWAEYIRERVSRIQIVVLSMMVMLIGSHTVAAIAGWDMSKYIRKGIIDVSETMISHGKGDYSKNVPLFVTGSNYPEPYKRGIKFLKDNKMNVFMENSLFQKYRN